MTREHIHLIGIGGTGMAALAGLLHESGCRVTGSDGPLYPPTSTFLSELGLEVWEGYDAAHLDARPDLIVVGNAISRGNPELEETLDRDLDYTSMPRLISERFLRRRHSLVVAGTHGKTTTASMLAWVLAQAGREPGFLIGGLPRNFRHPFRVGRGPAFVIEGDEYDTAFFDKGPKFMHYRPDTVLLGTIEFDHADIYRDLEQVSTAFRRLIGLVPRCGLVVRHEDCAVTREVTDDAPCRVEGYGFAAGVWRAEGWEQDGERALFRVLRGERFHGRYSLSIAGEHNVRNALAVIAAATEQGLSAEEIATGLATFEGVSRRLELRGEADGVAVLDDFAHHPTAIEATLAAARRRWPAARVWAVLEPRSWSLRRNVFQERLGQALAAADEVIVAPVYGAAAIPAAERLDPERLARDVRAAGRGARHLPDIDAIVGWLTDAARPGDVVVVMSNGAFGGLHAQLLDALAARARKPGRP